jgi:hypothetical protein
MSYSQISRKSQQKQIPELILNKPRGLNGDARQRGLPILAASPWQVGRKVARSAFNTPVLQKKGRTRHCFQLAGTAK